MDEFLAGVAICLVGARSVQIGDPWDNRRFVVCLEIRSLESLEGGLLVGTFLPA